MHYYLYNQEQYLILFDYVIPRYFHQNHTQVRQILKMYLFSHYYSKNPLHFDYTVNGHKFHNILTGIMQPHSKNYHG